MSVRVNIANGLRRTRKAAGKSVDDVGKVLGLSGKTISAWEVGRGQPDGDQLIAICQFLGARLSDFYGDEYDDISAEEKSLLFDYRACSIRGKEQIREYAAMVVQAHPKSDNDTASVQSA